MLWVHLSERHALLTLVRVSMLVAALGAAAKRAHSFVPRWHGNAGNSRRALALCASAASLRLFPPAACAHCAVAGCCWLRGRRQVPMAVVDKHEQRPASAGRRKTPKRCNKNCADHWFAHQCSTCYIHPTTKTDGCAPPTSAFATLLVDDAGRMLVVRREHACWPCSQQQRATSQRA